MPRNCKAHTAWQKMGPEELATTSSVCLFSLEAAPGKEIWRLLPCGSQKFHLSQPTFQGLQQAPLLTPGRHVNLWNDQSRFGPPEPDARRCHLMVSPFAWESRVSAVWTSIIAICCHPEGNAPCRCPTASQSLGHHFPFYFPQWSRVCSRRNGEVGWGAGSCTQGPAVSWSDVASSNAPVGKLSSAMSGSMGPWDEALGRSSMWR